VGEKKRRLFFALVPDAGERLALRRMLESAALEGGRRVPDEQWHVTLVFLGGVVDSRVACLIQAARSVRGQPFELILDRIGYWRRSQLLWLGSTAMPAELQTLVEELRAAVAPCEIALDDRPFKAHVTLVRDLRRRPGPRSIDPVAWRVTRFSLMESLPTNGGVDYRVVESWDLGRNSAMESA